MELERVFSCPGTLTKLRSGPLGIHLDGFCIWLLDRGFSRNTVRLHLANVSHLNEHLNRQKAAADKLCTTDVAEFFTAYPSWCRHRGPIKAHLSRVSHSIARFVEFLVERRLYSPCSKQRYTNLFLTTTLHGWRISNMQPSARVKFGLSTLPPFLDGSARNRPRKVWQH